MNAVIQFSAPSASVSEFALLEAAWNACSSPLAVSENNRILFANAAFIRNLGFQPGQDLRQMVVTTLPPGFSTPSGGARLQSREGGSLQFEFVRFFMAERVLFLLTASDRPLLLPPSPGSGPLESLGRLVSGVAHDFNNLLTGILLYCDLLGRALADDERLLRYVEEMRGAGQHAATLIQQLLDVARKHAAEPLPLSWNEVVSGLQNLLLRLIGENIQLICDLAPDLGRVRMRPAQMPQVILNLALNARDAMPHGGKLVLATRNSGMQVEFMVSDTGCGMDEDTRLRLLESGFTTKPPGQGNGLGLSTVRRIAEEQKGALDLESAPGRGTRVRLRLPRVLEDDSIQKGTSL